MKKLLFALLLIVAIGMVSGSAFGAVNVKEGKWDSHEYTTVSLDNATLVVGTEYIFEYSAENGSLPSNVTWIVENVEDGTQNAYLGNPVRVSFSTSGEYNVTVKMGDSVVYGPHTVKVHEGPLGMALALIGAGIAVGASGMGAAIGVGIAGASGAAAVAENKNRFRTAFIFQAFPQTQGIYGLLVGILILMSTGALTGGGLKPTSDIPVGAGLMALGAGLSVGIAGLSAVGQGIVAGTGVGVTRKQGTMGKAVVFTVLPETQAIYGLLVAILLWLGMNAMIKGSTTSTYALAMGIAAVGVGLGMGLSGITAIGQGIAASSGSAATAQNPRAFSSAIIFSVLPETQSIYALLAGILVIMSMGLMTGAAPMKSSFQAMLIGLGVLGVGFSVGLAGISGIGQGITAGAGAAAYVKNPSTRTQSIVLSVMSETYAIFGLLMAILIMMALRILGG
jgi:F0F1-type ATP synthase membrane subunit c/vacuolar-type H+-ATPase subunit K